MSRPKGSKNKSKTVPPIDRLEELLDWGPKIEAFCAKKGFPPSELIEKFEGLEESLRGAEKELTDLLESEGLNKPNTAPKIEKGYKIPRIGKKARKGLKMGMKRKGRILCQRAYPK